MILKFLKKRYIIGLSNLSKELYIKWKLRFITLYKKKWNQI